MHTGRNFEQGPSTRETLEAYIAKVATSAYDDDDPSVRYQRQSDTGYWTHGDVRFWASMSGEPEARDRVDVSYVAARDGSDSHYVINYWGNQGRRLGLWTTDGVAQVPWIMGPDTQLLPTSDQNTEDTIKLCVTALDKVAERGTIPRYEDFARDYTEFWLAKQPVADDPDN